MSEILTILKNSNYSNVFFTRWHPSFVHAPGPKVTIEIQFAQDDFNFLGYKLGERLEDSQVESTMQELHLRGLKDTKG